MIKTTQRLFCRFDGASGKRNLIDCICRQSIIAGDKKLARKLANAGILLNVRKGKKIIIQGASDNDIYLIISGNVAILINGRNVALRGPEEIIGEMSLLDPAARRSSTAIAIEPTVLLKISEDKFSNIASKSPDLWRRIAVKLTVRLRERSKFHQEPHSKPVVFIGSSREGLEEAKIISKSLGRGQIVPNLWSEGSFHVSKTTIEDLLKATLESDFAVLVITSDDVIISRGKKKQSPRDNVIFELGLFMGVLGRERTFIVNQEGTDIKIPTDLLGVTTLEYKYGSKKTTTKRFRNVIRRIRKIISRLGPK
jgi:predicted nucleotide-binding protein